MIDALIVKIELLTGIAIEVAVGIYIIWRLLKRGN